MMASTFVRGYHDGDDGGRVALFGHERPGHQRRVEVVGAALVHRLLGQTHRLDLPGARHADDLLDMVRLHALQGDAFLVLVGHIRTKLATQRGVQSTPDGATAE